MLKSGDRFGCSVKERVQKYYRSLNSILRVQGRSEDKVLLRLLEAHCVPILSYAIEVVHIADRDELRSLRVAYNDIFRKMFGYRRFESVTEKQHSLGRDTVEELVTKKQTGFLIRARKCASDTLICKLVSIPQTDN